MDIVTLNILVITCCNVRRQVCDQRKDTYRLIEQFAKKFPVFIYVHNVDGGASKKQKRIFEELKESLSVKSVLMNGALLIQRRGHAAWQLIMKILFLKKLNRPV